MFDYVEDEYINKMLRELKRFVSCRWEDESGSQKYVCYYHQLKKKIPEYKQIALYNNYLKKAFCNKFILHI